MKKSEIYKKAQVAVLESCTANLTKLEILRELMEREDMALLVEKQKEKEQANEAV